jgi:hypothetical protein
MLVAASRALALATVVACAIGCSSGSPPGADASDAAPPSSSQPATVTVPAEVTELVGEVHLHQYPDGSHAWAAFLQQGIPVTTFHRDSVTEIDTVVTKTDGPCNLYVAPTCTSVCLGATFCYAPDTCQPLPAWTYINGGEVDVTGSSLIPLIRMYWDAAASSYDSDPAPGGLTLFAGGEQLKIVGGTGEFAFRGTVPAPMPLVLLSPSPSEDFHMPLGATALPLTWKSLNSGSIEVLITASSPSGAEGEIRCYTDDTGSLTVPADLMAAMPPPPRATTFEILRNVEIVMPIARPGAGVFIHAGQTTWMTGMN